MGIFPSRKPKLTPLEQKQAELKEQQNLALLEAINKERLSHVDEYAKGYVTIEVEKVKAGTLIPSIEGFKTPEEIEASKVKAKEARGSRLRGLGKTILGAAPYIQTPHFAGDMASRGQAGSVPSVSTSKYGPLCPFCNHYQILHDSKTGICTPRNSIPPHHCGEVMP